MAVGGAGHQKSEQSERASKALGEAGRADGRGEARLARQTTDDSGSVGLLHQALTRGNRVLAWKRVKANAGSAGVDGLTVRQTAEYLKAHWPRLKAELLEGTYRPQPVRRVQIPKVGGGMRELGIPTVTDRLIQQALLQVLQPLIDPGFSEHSYGFRPGRRALDEWLRHRLRALRLKQWRRGSTMYRELRALGAAPEHAARIAGNSRRWWRNSRYELNRTMPISYFDRLGVPRLS